MRKLKDWYLNLEEGSPTHILVLVGAFVLLLVVGSIFQVPQLAMLVIPLALLNPRVVHRLQKGRPAYSLSRGVCKVRTRSVMHHPRYSGSVATGLANLGKRLWAPAWVDGVVDFTNEGIIWDPYENHLNFGFNAFTIPWNEIERVQLKRHWLHGSSDWGYLRISGAFGPPVDLYIYPFSGARPFFDSRRITISGG
jgi:hypothetical protein